MEDSRLPAIRDVVRDLLPGSSYRVTRVAEGGSTWVYRLQGAGDDLYLRVLPEVGAAFAPEVAVHRQLRDASVLVPDVLAWADHHPLLDRSVMVTSAIVGRDLEGRPSAAAAAIVARAGRDLAVVNQLAVAGYGWIQREKTPIATLEGTHASIEAWFADDVCPNIVALASSDLLTSDECAAIERIAEEVDALVADDTCAWLAHGDFDLTHVFAADDVYTGMIDFGEIRGTYALYDIGHFAIAQEALVPALLAGYGEVVALPADCHERIDRSMVLVAARRAGRWLTRRGTVFPPDMAAIRRGLERFS